MLATTKGVELAGNVIILVVSTVYALLMNRKVQMKISYEDCES